MRELTAGDIVQLIDSVAPFAGAASWDRVGLQVGARSASVEGVHVAIDPTVAAIEATRARGADVLVSHHPLILEPLEAVVSGHPVAERVMAALEQHVAVIAAHTNVDVVSEIATAPTARALGLEATTVLLPAETRAWLKIVVFVPTAAVEDVAVAMSEAGAGALGDYAECSFRGPGVGTFRPLEGASPAIGQVGRLEEVDEVRLEMMVDASRLDGVVAALTEAHPYEEVAYDVYRLESPPHGGFGCVGALAEPTDVEALARAVHAVFGATPAVRAATERRRGSGSSGETSGRAIRRVAVMPGSASGAARAALVQAADALVCGELKYHEALDAQESGLTVLTVGHDVSERPVVAALADALSDAAKKRGWEIRVSRED